MIRLIIGNHQVTVVGDVQSRSEPYDATPDSLWRAALGAARATIGSAPYDATALQVSTDSELSPYGTWRPSDRPAPCSPPRRSER